MTHTIDDKRANDERTEKPAAFAVATDSFMSGWGHAPGRSLFAIAVRTREELDTVLDNMEAREDFKRPRNVQPIKRGGKWIPNCKLRNGDHLSIRNREDCSRFFETGGFHA